MKITFECDYENTDDVSKAKNEIREEYHNDTGRLARVGSGLQAVKTNDYIEWLEISFHKLNQYFETIENCNKLKCEKCKVDNGG